MGQKSEQLSIHRTYAVGIFNGRFGGRMPSKKSFFFAPAGRQSRPAGAKTRNLGGGKPPPNPHRLSPVDLQLYIRRRSLGQLLNQRAQRRIASVTREQQLRAL